MNLPELQALFPTEDDCLAYLEVMRWQNGVRCVTCGGDKISRVLSKSAKQPKRRLYECLEPTCKQQFTVKSGTLMHDSKLPSIKWLMTILLIAEAKKGISSRQIARTLGVGKRTAWYLCHRIREAMKNDGANLLTGTVEMDETFIGGRKTGKGVYAGKKAKLPVMGVIERGGELRYQKVLDVGSSSIQPFVAQNISPNAAMVITDEFVTYPWVLKNYGDRHQTICHKKEYVRDGDIHTNSIEGAFGLFKRGFVGSFHRLTYKHLHRYLNEFATRYNNRKNKEFFHTLVFKLMRGTALPYKQLIAEEPMPSSA